MDRTPSDRPAVDPTHGLNRRRVLAGGVLAAGGAVVGARPARAVAQDASAVAATSSTGGEPAGTVTPARAAMAVERVPGLARDILKRTGVPGMSVALVHRDAVVLADGYGVRELGKDATVDADTVFQLASVSKSLAATVVSAVVGEGTVAWTSRMADVAPGFALHDAWPTQEVSLADLFSHRSGLPDHAGDLLEDLGFGRDEVLHRLRFLEPEYSFREGYAYTNFGLTAAAVAAATASGRSWEELSRQRLYRPLGMTHTSSRFADYIAEGNRAVPHVREGDVWRVTPEQRDPDAQTPAGGVSSSARELAQWVRLQLRQGAYGDKQVIPAAALAPTSYPQSVQHPPEDPATERTPLYGLGMNVSYTEFGSVQWSHSGAFALGAGTAYYLLPGSGFGVLALTNGMPVGAPEALCLSVLDLAQRGEVTRDWLDVVTPAFAALLAPTYGKGTDWSKPPSSAVPPRPQHAYVGTYENDYYGSAEVVARGDGLMLRIGPKPLELRLTHFDGDTFWWQPRGENAPVPSGLSFDIGPDGVALGFRDEYLTSGGPGFLGRTKTGRP